MITTDQASYILNEFDKTDWRDWEDPNEWVIEVLEHCLENNNHGCDYEGYAE